MFTVFNSGSTFWRNWRNGDEKAIKEKASCLDKVAFGWNHL